MEIDADRWQRLLDTYADIRDASPNFALLQTGHARAAKARGALADFLGRKPLGQRANEDIVAMTERDRRAYEQEVADATREVARVESLMATCAARRQVVEKLVSDVREWASAQGITLPGDNPNEIIMPGFGAQVGVPEPPRSSRKFGAPGAWHGDASARRFA